ncbi:MAG: mucoidy inhibitor MuiA family protein [Candidatus Omnitrophota bacterium]
MKKRGLIVLAAVVFFAGFASADKVDTVSAISQAVVYPSSARVTRVAKVSLKEGLQTVRFTGVVPSFDENSLSVSGKGSASVKILGAGLKTEYLKEASDDRVRELEAKIQAIDDALAAMKGEGNVLDQKKAFLDSVRLFNGNQLPKDLVTKVPSAEELKATMAFLDDGLKAHEDGAQALMIKLRDKNNERQVLANELAQVRSSMGGREERLLAVDLECEKAGDLTIELSYTVPQVGWYPLYDARVEFEKGKAALSAFAVVRQTTGEDWTDVALTLSTAKPAVGGRMPELSPWYLRPLVVHHYSNARSGGVFGALGGGMNQKAMMAESMSDMAAPALADKKKDAEFSYAQAESSGVSLVYKAARPVTIKSDGSEVRVPLTVQTLETAFEYTTTPKLSNYAYLKSRVTNAPDTQLLAGRVNIFLDGTYVGNSDISKTVAPGEAFDLYLGIDEGLTVKRELVSEKSDDTLIANIPSPNRKITYVYKITVENYKPRAVTLKLFDQVPVAQDDKIKVVAVQPSLKPETEKYQDRGGVYLWTLTLQPKEKKEVTLSYVVEYPRDLSVEGL